MAAVAIFYRPSYEGGIDMYEVKYDREHVFVLKDGKFWGTYDTEEEAYREIREAEGLV